MMLKKIITAAFSFLVLYSSAQSTFFKTYGGTNKEEGKCLALCSDGGFIIGADITLIPPAPDSSNILIVRTNSLGDTLWTRSINSGENDFCVKIIETSDLGFVVLANRINSANDSKIMLMKLNASGVIQWNKTFLWGGYGLTSYSFIEKMQGGYMICGAKTYADGLLINTNALGDTLWTKYYSDFFFHEPFHDVKQLADSTFVILGAHYNINIFEPRMFRIDGSGNIMYEKQYGNANLDDGIVLSLAHMQASNGLAFAGNSRTNQFNRFIIKVDSLFNIEWQQKYTLASNVISSIVQTQDSGFVFIAAPGGSTSAHCLMIKTNSSGTVSWAKEFQYASFRTPLTEYEKNLALKNLILTPDNGIAFCGFFHDTLFGNNRDLALIKTDANGNMPCDGISTNVVASAINYSPFNYTYNLTWGMLLTTSTLTFEGGIPTNNLCISTLAENNLEGESGLRVFPNPAANQFTIYPEYPGRFTISDIEIYSMLGEKVYSHQPETSNPEHVTVNVSTLTPGIYFVRLVGEKDQVIRKMVVQR